jgi:hypothetical protein
MWTKRKMDLDEDHLRQYRMETFRLKPGGQLKNVDDALAFVEERGFVFFWPVKGMDLPSLWMAVAGERPVASEHDDPGHITWNWKDTMLDKRQWYYGKLLRGKGTLVSMSVIPCFYALSERVGDLDDYMLAYEAGGLTWEEKSIAEALLQHGALHTIELRRRANLSATSAKSRFERALTALQRGLWVLPVGVAEAGSWRYAFIYELFDRWLPDIVSQARDVTRREAYRRLTFCYLQSVGAATEREIGRLFRWGKDSVQRALRDLEAAGQAYPTRDGRWVTSRLLDDHPG